MREIQPNDPKEDFDFILEVKGRVKAVTRDQAKSHIEHMWCNSPPVAGVSSESIKVTVL